MFLCARAPVRRHRRRPCARASVYSCTVVIVCAPVRFCAHAPMRPCASARASRRRRCPCARAPVRLCALAPVRAPVRVCARACDQEEFFSFLSLCATMILCFICVILWMLIVCLIFLANGHCSVTLEP